MGLVQLAFYTAVSQPAINFTSLSTRDGLSSNTINAIIKDSYGLLWIATEDGLNKFNGVQFTVYRNKPGDSTSLQANEILSMHEDKAGNLWVGTGGGALSLYNRKLNNFTHLPNGTTPQGIISNVVNAISSDDNGKIWVGTFLGVNIVDSKTMAVSALKYGNHPLLSANTLCIFKDSKHRMWVGTTEGLFVFDSAGNFKSHFISIPGDTGSLPHNQVQTITEDKAGDIWIGTMAGLCKKIKTGNKFITYPTTGQNTNHTASPEVNAIAADETGNLWLGTAAGVVVLNPETRQHISFTTSNRNVQSITGRSIKSIFFDNQGICWIGSYRGGISKYDKNLNLFNLVQSNPFDTKGLPAPIVTSFADAGNNKIFVGTDNGGVALFEPSTRTFKQVKLQTGSKAHSILALCHTRQNKLLAGTFGEGLFIVEPSGDHKQLLRQTGKKSICSNDIFCITEDAAGKIWLGTNGMGITVLNEKLRVVERYLPEPELHGDKLLPLNGFIRNIVQDVKGNMWIATHGGGVAMLNTATGKFDIYTMGKNNLPSDKVQSVLEDRRGNIWVGTLDGGLGLLDKTTGKFRIFSEKDGLPNNNIFKLIEDDSNRLWVSTNNGISSFNNITNKFSNYNTHNGLQPNSFVHQSGFKAASGDLYFGGLEGFNYFNPGFLVKNDNIPPVLFTDLKISNQSVAPSPSGPISENISVAKEINLNYRQNFAISFVGLNFSAPEQNKYAYKLDGFDKDWNYVGNLNTVSYTNLDPGKYVLHVKASNNDGVWNNAGSSIKIYVHPPFWQTNFAYALYFIMFAALVFLSRYRAIKKVKQKFQRKQELMQAAQQQREAEKVHELDQQKIKFLTNLSHEFRTPISLILAPIDTLVRQTEGEHSSRQLQMIKRNAKRLLNMVNQLLDFRKMEEQELKLNICSGELVSFVLEATDAFKDLSDRKKINFSFDSDFPRLDTAFDHDKLERILFNLLSNAFKFTLEGGSVSITLKKTGNKLNNGLQSIAIKVSDTGIGIPFDKQKQIFENFYQVNNNASILNQGTGIGLSITQEFVKLQGGKIEVQSDAGTGSTFTVTLPFKPLQKPLLETPAGLSDLVIADNQLIVPVYGEEAITGHHEYASVLVVEDNDDFRFYLKDSLRQHYKVLEASNGKEGWQRALAQHPQLIVSDISMPYMDGIELCKKIKADKRTNHIPVILLTALTGESNQLKGLETGANDYITKPFNVELLNAKVKNLLTLNDSLKNTYLKQIKVITPETVIESEDEKLLTEIMVYLEENLTGTQLSVEGLSRHIGMSRSSLYTKMLELTGETPVEFIRSVKLDKAAILLQKSNMNIAQVGYAAGFTTPNYFAKSFKAKFNMLPSEYITKMRHK